MGLLVHRGRDTSSLAEGLADLLADPLPDPFAEEIVAVPAKGVERWLAQRLSHRLGAGPRAEDGVCAGIRFLSPHSLVALLLGIDADDPWHPDRLVWPVLRAVDAALDEPWAGTLAVHLGHGLPDPEAALRRDRRYALARRLAGLFAQYVSQRPAMIADWRVGGGGDGLGGSLDDDLAWQPPLWRLVLDRVPAEPPDVRQARVVQTLRSPDAATVASGLRLPGRLSLFGHTRIARSEIEVIGALSERLDVHVWLPQASPAGWQALAPMVSAGPVPRDDDRTAELIRHPLLAGLGRDAREVQRGLALAAGRDSDVEPSSTGEPESLLHHLQHDLAADHLPDPAERAARVTEIADRTVQVHACHGPARQIEVLRDVLTDLLQSDVTLQPRDILVMCPDIETFAPLIHAGFGLGEMLAEAAEVDDRSIGAHPAHRLRVRLADRAPQQTNDLLGLAARLVELAGARVTVEEVLDLARAHPVRRRFGLRDDDVDRIGRWIDAAGVRWGLDAEHRSAYQLDDLDQNTWRAGLARILVGTAVDGREIDHLGATLGLDDGDSTDLDLTGRLAELISRLSVALLALRTATTAGRAIRAVHDGVLALAEVPPSRAWQLTQFSRDLELVSSAAAGDEELPLRLADLRALLAERAVGRPTRSSFRTGTLTVCTMVPMRSVPHRVVALVGLDDGVFPRMTTADGDDAMARRPVTGERDPRVEDRQLLLDAVMSAGETVVVTYTGFDEHTGAARPPAVPLGELIDAVRMTASGPGLDRIPTCHPLQPFDPRNLGGAGSSVPLLPGDRPFSYDPAALTGAAARRADRVPPTPVAAHRLPRVADDETDVDALLRFAGHPARAYLEDRLGLLLPETSAERATGIPIELDGRQTWRVGHRMLGAVLAGRDPGATVEAERRRGELPPGRLGIDTLHEITGHVQRVAEATWATTGRGGWGVALDREARDVDLGLPSGRRLTGTLGDMVGPDAVTASYARVRAQHRLSSWIVSLVLAASGDRAARSHLLGRHRWGRHDGGVRYVHGPHDPERAAELLDQLLDLRERGLREPLPLPPATALRWAESFLGGRDDPDLATAEARRAWETTGGAASPVPGEADDRHHVLVYGGVVALAEILGVPREDERWHPRVEHRLGQLALRVWGPVIAGDAERRERV